MRIVMLLTPLLVGGCSIIQADVAEYKTLREFQKADAEYTIAVALRDETEAKVKELDTKVIEAKAERDEKEKALKNQFGW